MASAESQYADPGTVSQRMLSQTATQPWQVDSSNNNDLDPEILVTSCILKETQPRPKTNDKVAKPNKLLPMLNLDESVQKMPSKGQAAAETEYTAQDFDPKGLSYYKI